jgi:hypothetical protein
MERCQGCPREIPKERVRHHAKYCSRECRQQSELAKARALNPVRDLPLPSGTVGALHELLVAADLLRRGYEVFRAVSQAASCDLAVLKEGHLLRVEVTTGYRHLGGGFAFPPRKYPDRHDVLAIVVGQEIHYQGLP